jgi:hypothetical protein
MRYFKRVCAGVVLTLALGVYAFAGQTPCGGIADPPPPQTATATTETSGEMSAGVVEAAVSFLLSMF